MGHVQLFEILEILAILSSVVAFASSAFVLLLSRRSVKRLKLVAKRNLELRREFEKAFQDKHFDESEMRAIIEAYNGFLENGSPAYRISSLVNRKARSILRNAVSHRNENLFVEIASEVVHENANRKGLG